DPRPSSASVPASVSGDSAPLRLHPLPPHTYLEEMYKLSHFPGILRPRTCNPAFQTLFLLLQEQSSLQNSPPAPGLSWDSCCSSVSHYSPPPKGFRQAWPVPEEAKIRRSR